MSRFATEPIGLAINQSIDRKSAWQLHLVGRQYQQVSGFHNPAKPRMEYNYQDRVMVI